MKELERMLAERLKRAQRERARTQSRKRERQNSLERTGTLRSREKLLLGRKALMPIPPWLLPFTKPSYVIDRLLYVTLLRIYYFFSIIYILSN